MDYACIAEIVYGCFLVFELAFNKIQHIIYKCYCLDKSAQHASAGTNSLWTVHSKKNSNFLPDSTNVSKKCVCEFTIIKSKHIQNMN